jgi:hypothetical protein
MKIVDSYSKPAKEHRQMVEGSKKWKFRHFHKLGQSLHSWSNAVTHQSRWAHVLESLSMGPHWAKWHLASRASFHLWILTTKIVYVVRHALSDIIPLGRSVINKFNTKFILCRTHFIYSQDALWIPKGMLDLTDLWMNPPTHLSVCPLVYVLLGVEGLLHVDKDGFRKLVNQWTCFLQRLSLRYAFSVNIELYTQRSAYWDINP